MAGTISKKRRLFLKQETTFGTEAGSTDGSDMTPVRTTSLDMPADLTEHLETNYFTGRMAPTAMIVGPSGAEITFVMPLQGLLTAAGDGVSVPADDVTDMIFESAFGDSVDTDGEGAGAGSTTTSLVLATDALALQSVAPIISTATGYAEWRRSASAASPYTLDIALANAPLALDVAYGAKAYRQTDDIADKSLTAVYDLDGIRWTFKGGRPTSIKADMVAGKPATLSVTLKFDSIVNDTSVKTALPTVDVFAGTPIMGQLGSFVWGSTAHAAKSVSVDFGLESADDASFAGANGRSNIQVMNAIPVVTVEPLFLASFWDDKVAGTNRALGVKFGRGALSGGAINTCFFHAELAELAGGANPVDDAGKLRSSLNFKCIDEGVFSGTTASQLFQYLRA